MGELNFARWRSHVASGGNRYDDEIVSALRMLGRDVREHNVTGSWPVPDALARKRLADVLQRGETWLIDNILSSAAPQEIAVATAAGAQVTTLVHYFPGDDSALGRDDRRRLRESEAETVCLSTHVVASSGWTAREVSTRYGRDDAVVAHPGVVPVDPAPGSAANGGSPLFTWMGRMTADKDPLTFVDALSALADLDWRAQLVGPDCLDVNLTDHVRSRIAEAGLHDRVQLLGNRSGDHLAAVWRATDLLVHTARTEAFGMVVTEALAHAIPAVVPSGTGAEEAQRVGDAFASGEPSALAARLRAWLTDPDLRRRWRHEAESQRHRLPTWEDAARIIAETLDC